MVNQKKEKQRLFSRVILILYYIGNIGAAAYVLTHGSEIYLLSMLVATALIPAALTALYRILRFKRMYLCDTIIYIFSFLSITFASVLDGYNKVPYLDKLLHCASGFLFAVVGMLVFYYLKPGRKKESQDAPLVSVFVVMFAMGSAVLWEIYEYFISFTGSDPQAVALTGVGDTMQDMIVCTIGGFLTAVWCFRYIKGGKPGLMMSIFENFYELNIKGKG